MRSRTIVISVILMSLVLMGTALAYEKNFNTYFYEANSLYQRGDFERAAKTYERILSEGVASANMYYNLGNAYVRLEDYGRALLNYERARRLAPRDSQIIANIQYVKSLLSSGSDDSDSLHFISRMLDIYRYFTVNEVIVATSLFYFTLVVLIGITMLRRELKVRFKLPMMVTSIFLLVSLTLTVLNIYNLHYRQEAIVLASEQVARFEPSLTGTTYFPLSCGDKVVIREVREDWVYITSVSNKRSGWVHVDGLEAIF
jgi:tetratricopeptide (TPR) repeat protein